jgi:two-component system sensor histidine kinase KdpD
VLAAAVLGGLLTAFVTALVSMVAFNFLFLPPLHTLSLADSRNWAALTVYVVTAVVVSELATRARRQARAAEQREREAALLADAAASLLQSDSLGEIRQRAEEVLRTGDAVARRRFEAAVASLVQVAQERERLAELRRSDAIKTSVLQSVSHDFRTPLATISAAVDGLQSDELSLTQLDRTELLDTMRVEVDRLVRLVGNLLDLSRLQAGAAAPRTAVWPVDALLARSLADVPGADRVDVELDSSLPPVEIDDVQIQRVLVNVIENALKFSRARVTVGAHTLGQRVVIEILDAGGAGEPGAGLGLSIARGFAAANGGSVELEPIASGGMRTRVELPAAALPVGAGL